MYQQIVCPGMPTLPPLRDKMCAAMVPPKTAVRYSAWSSMKCPFHSPIHLQPSTLNTHLKLKDWPQRFGDRLIGILVFLLIGYRLIFMHPLPLPCTTSSLINTWMLSHSVGQTVHSTTPSALAKPPFSLLNQVITKIIIEPCMVVLTNPEWRWKTLDMLTFLSQPPSPRPRAGSPSCSFPESERDCFKYPPFANLPPLAKHLISFPSLFS